MLNIARTLARSRVNGPGERFVAWAQGCTLRCPGCWNPDTWSIRHRRIIAAEVLADEIRQTPSIEGVTFTGGEPFQQAAAFADVAEAVRMAGLSVMAFTGYELHELDAPAQRRLLASCDIVVSGRYLKAERVQNDGWRGSSNQIIHFLSDRYRLEDQKRQEVCEFHLNDEGGLVLTGFPADGLLTGGPF